MDAKRRPSATTRSARIGIPLAVGLLAAALWAAASVAAQTPDTTPLPTLPGTPVGTPILTIVPATATPVVTTNTALRVNVVAEKEPVPKGDQFEAQLQVENVEHLASFDFTIDYDPKKLAPVEEEIENPTDEDAGLTGVRVLDVGQFLGTGPRGQGIVCDQAKGNPAAHTVSVSCVTFGPPVCLDGLAGASGTGLLGRIIFTSKGGGTTKLVISTSTLALDDYVECRAVVTGATELPNSCLPFRGTADSSATETSCQPEGTAGVILDGPADVEGQPWYQLEDLGWAPGQYLQADGQVGSIPHNRFDAEVRLEKSGSPWLIIIIIVVVVVLVVGGGAGGYLWYRRRSVASS